MSTSDPLNAQLRAIVDALSSGSNIQAETLAWQLLNANATNADVYNLLGIAQKRQGKLLEAERTYRDALIHFPHSPVIASNLGNLYLELGDLRNAELYLSKAARDQLTGLDANFNLALCKLRQNRPSEAREHLSVLATHDYHPHLVLNLLGNAAIAEGDNLKAADFYRAAIKIDPSYHPGYANLATALLKSAQFDSALEMYSAAINICPTNAEYIYNFGNAYRELGDLQKAEEAYRHCLALSPGFSQAYNNLGAVLKEQSKFDQALCVYATALERYESDAVLHHNLAVVLIELKRWEEAKPHLLRAITLSPTYSDAHNALGLVYKNIGRINEAETSFRTAIEQDSNNFAPHYSLAVLLHGGGRIDELKLALDRALQSWPSNPKLRWLAIVSVVSPGSAGEAEDIDEISQFRREILKSKRFFDRLSPQEIEASVCSQPPFFLAYKKTSNVAILRDYGEIVSQLIGKIPLEAPPKRTEAHALKTVCVLAHHLSRHSVYKAITYGLVKALLRNKFDVIVYCPEPEHFEDDLFLDKRIKMFRGLKTLQKMANEIRALHPQALIYTELGMRPSSCQLAALRLAPLQILFWGHPETSGMPNIDYFVSAEAFEPPNAIQMYTERLIALPRLGTDYQKPAAIAKNIDISFSDLRKDIPIVVCPGTPFKYESDFYSIIEGLLSTGGRAQYVFFEHPNALGLTNKLKGKLEEIFLHANNSDSKLIFLPWLEELQFNRLLSDASVALDSIHFSGFNTAVKVLEAKCPLVAYRGRYMRGRLASGILEIVGLPDLIACTIQDYISIAKKLIKDSEFNKSVRNRIEFGISKIYQDEGSLDYFASWLRDKLPETVSDVM